MVGFTLSKSPQLHRGYLVILCKQMSMTVHETPCFMFAKWYNAVRRHIRPPCQRTSRGRIKQLRTTRQAAALVKLSMTGFMKVLLA